MKKILTIICFLVFFLNLIIISAANIDANKEVNPLAFEDFDPLVDIEITIDILEIRALDKIDLFSDPDFFIKVIINDEEFTSDVFFDKKYLYDCFSVTKDVPDDEEFVKITIQLWDYNPLRNKLCDISERKNTGKTGYDLTVFYNIKTGRWSGDDYIGDSSGYGRGNGCGDGSIYKNELDCEIYFNIYQNDYDGDGIPYWTEVYVYGTDPTVDDRGRDDDNDGIPIEWEHKWGFNPFIWDDHHKLDPDGDSISNYEEYLTLDFGSDPFRKDLFLEIDYMQEENGDIYEFTAEGKEYLRVPFNRREIVIHFDTGEKNGGQIIPFKEKSTFEEVRQIWFDYFMNGDEENWIRGVFHYGLFVHNITLSGFAFSGDVFPYMGYLPGTNSFVVSNTVVDKKSKNISFNGKNIFFKDRDYIMASMIMHEMGHNFGIRWGHPFGCDSRSTISPFRIGYWFYRNYKSIMNYRYTYFILDYSDGSHGKRDYNDWANIDLSYFEKI
jgi:hypothetical protein